MRFPKAIFLVSLLTLNAEGATTPPQTQKVEFKEKRFGVEIADPYRWMEKESSEEVKAWIDAQNTYTEGQLGEGIKRWEAKLRKVYQSNRVGLPTIAGKKLIYFKRPFKVGRYSIYMQDENGREKEIVNDNQVLPGEQVVIEDFKVDSKGRFLAYRYSLSGGDWLTTKVLDLTSGKTLSDTVKGMKWFNLSWLPDASGFFYMRYADKFVDTSDSVIAADLYFHRLGDEQSKDALILPARTDKHQFGVALSHDGRFLVVNENPGSDFFGKAYVFKISETYLKNPSPLKLKDAYTLGHNFSEEFWFVGNRGEESYWLTTQSAPTRRLVKWTPAKTPALVKNSELKTLVPATKFPIEYAARTNSAFVLTRLEDSKAETYTYDLQGAPIGRLTWPELNGNGSLSTDEEHQEFYVAFESFLSPRGTYRVLAAQAEPVLWKVNDFPGLERNLVSKQAFVTTKDGAKIPIFISHRADLKSENAPTILHGYGCYGVSQTPTFSEAYYQWMQDGGIHISASIRGGGEYGSAWHAAGKGLRKKTSYEDFAAVADYLVANKVTTAKKLVSFGASCGGPLSANLALMRPELMAGSIVGVGIVDLLNFHRFSGAALWISELGDPAKAKDFKFMREISPLHNINPSRTYPAFLVLTGTSDTRVVPVHSYKFTATLQDASKGRYPVFLHTEKGAGHSGPESLDRIVNFRARMLAFAERVTH
jgi:prolyl oligopeptidase